MNDSNAKTLTPTVGDEYADLPFFGEVAIPPPAWKARPCLWIRTAAGPSVGFGHLVRSLALAGLLKRSLEPLFLLDRFDAGSLSQVAARGLRYTPFRPGEVWSKLPLPCGVLIDTRLTGGTTSLLEGARSRGIPVFSIHDLGLSPLPSDIVIDGSMLPAPEQFPRRDTSFYTGTSYLVLDPTYGLLHRRSKPVSPRIKTLTLSLGGGNSREAFVKVLQGLRLWNRRIDVVGIPGFSRWGQEELAQNDWQPVRFRWAASTESVARLMFQADLALTTGGLAVFEALCAGTPVMALSVDSLQQITVSMLAKDDVCINLGLVGRFDPVQLPESLSNLDADHKRRCRMSQNGRRLVDGLGAQRVSQIICRHVFRPSATSVARSEP